MDLTSWDECIRHGDVATLSCINVIFWRVVNILLMFAGLVFVIIIIISGFKFMNSAGDPKTLDGARNTLMNAIIGITIVIVAFLILNIVSTVTGVNVLRETILPTQ
jgi:Mn2+/Fe2+ NRAMP family transporter